MTVLSLTGLVNLPYRYVERDGRWIGNRQFADNDSMQEVAPLPTMAGWPIRYWVRYPFEDQIEDRYWSTPKLLVNLGLGIALAAIVFAFTRFRHRAIASAGERRSTRLMFDLSFAMVILLAPLAMIALAQRTKSQHWRTIRQANRFGNCYVSSWLPAPIANGLPAGLVAVFSRLRDVELVRPDATVLKEVFAVETLTGFRFHEGRVDADLLGDLSSNVHFSYAHFLRCRMDEALLDSISRSPWLVELSLRNTNLDSEMFHRLDSMQHLRSVDVLGTQVQVSQLGKPDWSSSVVSLRLPRPNTSTDKTLTIDGWPRLRTLVVIRRSFRLNESTLTVRLSHLPNLEDLYLDRVQKHALIVNDLPRLSRIDENATELFFELGTHDSVPGLTWLTDLHLNDVPSLTRVGCFARDLRTMSINKAPNLRRLEMGSYRVFANGAMLESVDRDRCQTWIDVLGAGDGPVIVDLTALPLAGIDLQPLVANPRIRHLRLGNTGVSFEQIKGLGEMTQLERLGLGDCPLEQDELSWLLEHFPQLTELHVDVTRLETFELAGNRDLRRLGLTIFEQLRDLRIADVPDLDCHLHLACAPQRILIRNAQSLRGLAVEQPWPKDAEVSGFRDLDWFAAGGAEADDSLVDALLLCETVDRLTLAHTSISPEKLCELGSLTKLTSLVLPGSPVDDEVTANWRPLTRLQELDLGDTSVSVGTISWLQEIASLRRLAINRVSLTDAAAAALAELMQLTELELADASVNSQLLIPLLRGDNLERLDISGVPLRKDFVDALANCDSINWLTMHQCQLSNESLQQIANAKPLLRIDLGEQTEGYSAELIANLAKRLDESESEPSDLLANLIITASDTFEVIESEAAQDGVENVASSDARPRQTHRYQEGQPGLIDPERFRQAP